VKVPKLSMYAFRSVVRAMTNRDALQGGALPEQLRERIVLHVSSINHCAVCSTIHTRSALARGLEPDDVTQALARDHSALDERTRAALRYAELRTLDRLTDGSDEVTAAVSDLERFYSPEERSEIDAVVDLFTFYNRANNTWEGLLPGARSRRRKLGIAD
jgi:AhpD family alkylhydroperoxidase